MMRHAFLIIAHNNWWQLRKLIESLDSENHDIYVHIDKKSKDFDESDFMNACKLSKILFFQEYEVFWGGFSQVQVEMLLLSKAFPNHYDYYHIISGADLPLKSNTEIDALFERNQGKEFILYDEDKLKNDPEITRRTRYYHFLQNNRRRYAQQWKNNLFTFLERVSLVVQILFRVNRVKGLDWEIKYGSQWVSITDDLVKTILYNAEKIMRVFSCTNCADELFIQTVAYNCGFKERIYQPESNQYTNLRLIDWNRGNNGSPYTYKINDRNTLIPSGGGQKNLFARKFSQAIDRDIIEYICEKLHDLNKPRQKETKKERK